MNTETLASAHKYAQANGYTGTITAYVRQQYECYVEICQRCDVVPMTFNDWSM